MRLSLPSKIFITLLVAVSLNAFSQAPDINPAAWSTLKGLWKFDNPTNLTQASFGTNLLLTGTHTSIPGPTPGNLAVNIGIGSYYTCYHNIPANGGGSEVNEYSLAVDFRIPSTGPWYCFYQTNATNSNDGELFISPGGTIGRATNGPGYSEYAVIPGEWYRLVVTADLGSHYKMYLDGILIRDGGSLTPDSDYALYPSSGNNFFYWFADNDGEDAPIDIALCAIFEGVLTPQQADTLGGYGHDIPPVLTGILPYLQSPTPTSIYICWHSDTTGSTKVQYGTTSSLGSMTNGSYEAIGTKKWQTVKLTGLQPDTEYFYKCISGTEESDLYAFRTPPAVPGSDDHIRFLIFGDNQTNSSQSRFIASQAKLKMQQLFGNDIQNHINLIINHGDIVGDGTNVNLFEDEFFKPFSSLTCHIPTMVSIGNHEMESNYYYQYMKYEEQTTPAPPLNERYYSFRLGNAKFISLNTNIAYQNTTQESWLAGQLSQSESDELTDFVFAYGHHPGHSEIWPDGNTSWVQNQVYGQMQQYSKSALYVSGHTHGYENGVWESAVDSGDFRIQISGGAGGGLDRWGMYANQTDYPEIQKSLDHYCFTLIDVDITAQAYTGYTYSLGHPDKPLSCELADVFHRKLTQPRPPAPLPIGPSDTVSGFIMLRAGPYAGTDSLMTSHFQITDTPGNFTTPVFESKRNRENFYEDSGFPDYLPVNLSQGIDLSRVDVSPPLATGQTYSWRVRYRDYNLCWSEWSCETIFTYLPSYAIGGQVLYDNAAQTPLRQVNVTLFCQDTLLIQVTTDSLGQFTFPPVIPGQYQMQCSSSRPWGGVNATDALLILKHFVNLSPLQGIRKSAGDADGSSVINAVDALAVSKRFTGTITQFPRGDWVFETSMVNVVNSGVTTVIRALCTGDVNGSNIPAP